MAPAGGIRCRQIGPADLDAVADFLTIGFPRHSRKYWIAALRCLEERDVPEGFPRYGYMLTDGNHVTGALLLIFSDGINGRVDSIRCNLSSWYVTPDFRALAPMLLRPVLRYKQVTFINTSPAEHTLRTVQAQGFEQFCNGVFAATPALTTRSWIGKTIHASHAHDYLPEFEAALLQDHAARGCLSVILQHNGNLFPVVFRRRMVGQRSKFIGMPCAQLIYARDLECIGQFSGLIGRYLALRGMPVLLIGANQKITGLSGKYYEGRTPMYYKGPDRPRLGDLAYTEAALFGI
jgi:hypothetical protein